MKVIALRGEKDTGKSHTINVVYHFLLRDNWVQVPGHFRLLGNPDFEDFLDILSKDSLVIGIIGMGDYIIGPGSVKNLLKELENKGCHVAICACRTSPKIEAAVNGYPEHVWVEKTLSAGIENNRIVNVANAIQIINNLPL
jgi:hypothetical protein